MVVKSVKDKKTRKVKTMHSDVMIDNIIDLENGKLSFSKTIKLFSELIRSGKIHTMQGHYGRVAKAMIEGGYIDRYGKILRSR